MTAQNDADLNNDDVTVDLDCPDRNHPMHNAAFCLRCAFPDQP